MNNTATTQMSATQATILSQVRSFGLSLTAVYDQDKPEQLKLSRGFKGAYVEYDKGTDTYHVQAYRVNREDYRCTFRTPVHYLMVEQMAEAVRAAVK